MEIKKLEIPDLLLIQPYIYYDNRGAFFETWNHRNFSKQGIPVVFLQDNHSSSRQNTIRGLHYQIIKPQAKLVRVLQGEIFDVAVDLRRSSHSFGQWAGIKLTASSKSQLYIPEGFAHGFLVLSEFAEVEYKVSDYYNPDGERCIIWNDPTLSIQWPIESVPVLSTKDANGLSFAEAEYFA